MSWSSGPLLGFDTETTGVDPETDRLVTAALVLRADGRTTTRGWLVDPGVEIPAGASAVHGITTEHARTHGRPPAEALEEIAEELARAVVAGIPVVAFNAPFDLTLLDRELRRHGLRPLTERLAGATRDGVEGTADRPPVRDFPVLDPLVLDRAVDRYRRGKRTLGVLCELYGLDTDPATLHTAAADVVATLDVLAAIAARYPEVASRTLAELHAFQVGAHRAWAEGFNAWRTSRGHTGPGADTSWPVKVFATAVTGGRDALENPEPARPDRAEALAPA